jgi:hypothetical protein
MNAKWHEMEDILDRLNLSTEETFYHMKRVSKVLA